MDLDLKGKRALVLGSSQGIGKAIAQTLVEEGAQVMLASRSEERLQKTVKEIKAHGFCLCDTNISGSGTAAVQAASQKLVGLDILVHCTGGPKKGEFLEISQDQWKEDYQSLWLNFTECLNSCLPAMKAQGFGRILLVSSIAAREPLPLLTTSNALRAGLAGLVKTLSTEVAKDGITLNILLPGYTDTERLRALNLSDERVKQMVPAGRLANPAELADLAAFLASPRAGYITAQSIAVDGGVLKGTG